jgi:hypothetical protein
MKKLLIISCVFLLSTSFTSSKNNLEAKINPKVNDAFNLKNDGIESYRKEINRAFSLLKKQKERIVLELNIDERVPILSIAFPELIRYNSYSDYLETSSNKILYVDEGKNASDFSTGYFQMKPSFIEDLENYVANTANLKSYNWILIQKKNQTDARKERIKRLGNFQWQLRYLKVFWYAAEYKYQNIDFKSTEEKIRFFATAYNYGFLKPENEIANYQFKKKFSPTERRSAEKFAFADFSIDFIKTYSYFFN